MLIYALIDPVSKEVRYVGRTSRSIEVRVKQHVHEARRVKGQQKWCHAWIKTLLDVGLTPNFRLLEEITDDSWAEAERKWIAHFEPSGLLTNLTSGGEKYPGYSLSVEHRRRISEGRLKSKRARKASQDNIRKVHAMNQGRTLSDEHKQKIRESGRGRVKSVETRKLISDALKGKKKTPEHKASLSSALSGRVLTEDHRLSISLGSANAKKTHCPQGHAYSKLNTYVRSNGERECRDCMRQRDVERYQNNPNRKIQKREAERRRRERQRLSA